MLVRELVTKKGYRAIVYRWGECYFRFQAFYPDGSQCGRGDWTPTERGALIHARAQIGGSNLSYLQTRDQDTGKWSPWKEDVKTV